MKRAAAARFRQASSWSSTADTVIAAVGEQVEGELFTANGIAVNAKDIPGFCTNLENVYVGGDAMRGPATVVEGIADAQRFADIVIGAPHTLSVPENAHVTREEAISKKGILSPPTVGCEGNRCLHCNTVCQVCADVCPNRAMWSSNSRVGGTKFSMWTVCARVRQLRGIPAL